jgi:hypothetical protein
MEKIAANAGSGGKASKGDKVTSPKSIEKKKEVDTTTFTSAGRMTMKRSTNSK